MKVHSDILTQRTLGQGAKVTQITHLIAPCWRSLWYDWNGHLDHSIWSPGGKVMPPGRSSTRPCQASRGRPALHLPKTTPTDHHALVDSLMDPQTLGRHAQSKAKARRPHILAQMGSQVATRSWADHARLDLHLHAKKHKKDQCQPLDGS
jgi:hypothetical protein